jgi:small subunit ribosomal protein S1
MAEATETRKRLALSELEPKMRLEGTVTNIELYGAFVDIGAEKDGLVHISQISETQVNRVADVLNEGQSVTVWVRNVELDQGRISLTMIEPPEHSISDLEAEQVVTGKVTKITPYGAFVDIGAERDGLVHISEMAEGRIDRPSDVVQEGEEIQVRVVKVNRKRHRIELSMLNIREDEGQPQLEEGEEASLTAMELAWQNAMEREGMSLSVPKQKKGRRQHKAEIRRQQAAIIARTLKNQSR